MFHCLFEQSGTFKNEFKKLGYQAEDYDILNDFGETDHVIDLFDEINVAYNNLYKERERETIFDSMDKNKDQVLAFFPCTRFEVQIIMAFKGTQNGKQNWSLEQHLLDDLKLHDELHELYSLITKLALVCLKLGLKLIIENPYNTQHYLVRYWCINYSILDTDRRDMGDYYKKPTQYFFINREPSHNFIFESIDYKKHRQIIDENKVDRSMIAPEYANRFIREFILEDYSCDMQ